LIGRANFSTSIVSGALHNPAQPLRAAALAARHGFTRPEDCGSFYSTLFVGEATLSDRLQRHADTLNSLVTSILASPEAQLA
jgi:hypothetical protein